MRTIHKKLLNPNRYQEQWSGLDHSEKINYLRCTPFFILHLLLFLGFFVHMTFACYLLALMLYIIRMFAITGFYHRYFSHKTFSTSKAMEVVFAIIGMTSIQQDPIWWASHHRHHHKVTDKPEDEHSPISRSFLTSHFTWFFSNKNYHIKHECVKDLLKKKYLVLVCRFEFMIYLCFAALISLFGFLCETYTSIKLTPLSAFYSGFVLSTLAVHHVTFSINSFLHKFGFTRYATEDNSKNNWILAILAMGEGWHNNHHHYPATVKQGFRWYEIDLTYYLLLIFNKLGLVWDLKKISKNKMEENLL